MIFFWLIGTGDVRLLRHTEKKGKVRLLMRRDKTLRICANHYIQAWFQLKAMRDSERAFIWLVQADYADEEAKTEVWLNYFWCIILTCQQIFFIFPKTLAIRFANAENAKKFKDAFDEAVVNVIEWEATRIADAESKLRSPLKKDKVDQDEAAKKGDTADDASEKLDSLTIK